MQRVLIWLVVLSCTLLPTPAYAQEPEIVEKTVCLSATGFPDVTALKGALLTEVKREAVNEFFGELISASTAVENLVVTSDQIQASSLGFVRIFGDPSYYNGSNLAEVCVTIQAYVTASDRAQFEPVAVSKRLCLANSDLTADALAALVKKEVVIQALYDYDPKLEAADRTRLPELMERITYSEGGFLQDTTTYCATMGGYVTPVEMLAFATGPEPVEEESVSPEGAPSTVTESDVRSRFAEPCAEAIELGQMLDCSLDAETSESTHTFVAEADDLIYLQAVRTDGDIVPALRLLDPIGKVVNTNIYCEDSGEKAVAIACRLERSGEYAAEVYSTEEQTSGTYRFHVQRLNSPGMATALEYGDSVRGDLALPMQVDYYMVDASADDRLLVRAVRESGDVILGANIRGKNGEVINTNIYCEDDDPNVVTLNCVLELSGTDTIVVWNTTTDRAGSYRLDVERLNAPGGAVTIEPGEAYEGELTQPYENHLYSFNAEAGDSASVEVTRSQGDLQPAFELLDKTGEIVSTNIWCAVDNERVAEATCELDRSGSYTLVVYSRSVETAGSYTLKISLK